MGQVVIRELVPAVCESVPSRLFSSPKGARQLKPGSERSAGPGSRAPKSRSFLSLNGARQTRPAVLPLMTYPDRIFAAVPSGSRPVRFASRPVRVPSRSVGQLLWWVNYLLKQSVPTHRPDSVPLVVAGYPFPPLVKKDPHHQQIFAPWARISS